MHKNTAHAENNLPLPILKREAQPNVADQVFDALRQGILTLDLPPLAKISETEVAARMGVSRQPVREAFKRLARLGLLQIRPQSGTTVSLISEQAIQRARFIRTALEIQTTRTACAALSDEDLTALTALIEAQKDAVAHGDRDLFHQLDEQFHREICARAGLDYVWDLIQDHKAHMDRIRMLSLSTSSQQQALAEHIEILAAIAARQPDVAASRMTAHLARIDVLIREVKAKNHEWFLDQPD